MRGVRHSVTGVLTGVCFFLGLRVDCYLKWANQQFFLSSKVSSENGFVQELFFTSSKSNTKEALLATWWLLFSLANYPGTEAVHTFRLEHLLTEINALKRKRPLG